MNDLLSFVLLSVAISRCCFVIAKSQSKSDQQRFPKRMWVFLFLFFVFGAVQFIFNFSLSQSNQFDLILQQTGILKTLNRVTLITEKRKDNEKLLLIFHVKEYKSLFNHKIVICIQNTQRNMEINKKIKNPNSHSALVQHGFFLFIFATSTVVQILP